MRYLQFKVKQYNLIKQWNCLPSWSTYLAILATFCQRYVWRRQKRWFVSVSPIDLLTWDHALKERIQSINQLPTPILIKLISIMILCVQEISSCMYREMELIVPSTIDDIPDRPIITHSIVLCFPYFLLCLIITS